MEHGIEGSGKQVGEVMPSKLNKEGCASKRKLIHRQEEGESGSGELYDVK